jgi:hypothetical protein
VNGRLRIWMRGLARGDHQYSSPFRKSFNFRIQAKGGTVLGLAATSKNRPDLMTPAI